MFFTERGLAAGVSDDASRMSSMLAPPRTINGTPRHTRAGTGGASHVRRFVRSHSSVRNRDGFWVGQQKRHDRPGVSRESGSRRHSLTTAPRTAPARKKPTPPSVRPCSQTGAAAAPLTTRSAGRREPRERGGYSSRPPRCRACEGCDARASRPFATSARDAPRCRDR